MRTLSLGAPTPKPKPSAPPRPAPEPRQGVQVTGDPELLLLSCILGDPDHLLWPRARHLPVAAFTNRECSGVWAELLAGRQMPEDLFAIAKASKVEVARILELSHLAGIGLCFPQVLAEIEGKHRLREIRRLGAAMANSESDDVLEWARRLERIGTGARIQAEAESFNAYDIVPDGDPSILLGDSYVCRGDGLVLTSTSGMGKSSMAYQMACCFALPIDFHGLKSNGPLYSLMIQAEDSRGDIGMVRRSVYHMMGLTPAQQETIGQRVKIVTKKGLYGAGFLEELRRLVAKHKPDLVWINPLQAFIDGDITSGPDLSAFLRQDLDGVNADQSFAWMIVHHTTKPPKGKDRAELQWHEVMYDMSGGAEIINWARAIISLRAAQDRGDFNLVLAKRGTKADVTRQVEQGAGYRDEIVTTLPLKWSEELIGLPGRAKKLKAIFWEARIPDPHEADRPKGPGGRPSIHDFATYRNAFPTDPEKAQKPIVILRACDQFGDIKKASFFRMLKQAVTDGLVFNVGTDPAFPRYYLRLAK